MSSAQTLRDAVLAIKAGDRARARQIIITILKSDPQNANAWYLIAVVTDDKTKQGQALERCLRIDPAHERARRMRDTLQGTSLPPSPDAALIQPTPKPGKLPLWLFAGIILVLIGIALGSGIILVVRNRQNGSATSIAAAAFAEQTRTAPSGTPLATTAPVESPALTPTEMPTLTGTPTLTPTETFPATSPPTVTSTYTATRKVMTFTAIPTRAPYVIPTSKPIAISTGGSFTIDFGKYPNRTPLSAVSAPYTTFATNGEGQVFVSLGHTLRIEEATLSLNFAAPVSAISFDWMSAGVCKGHFQIELFKGQDRVDTQSLPECDHGTYVSTVDFDYLVIQMDQYGQVIELGNMTLTMPKRPASLAGPTPRYMPTITPGPSPTFARTPDMLLLHDSLTDPANSNQWLLVDNDTDTIAMTKQGLSVTVKKQIAAWSYPNRSFAPDIDLTVTAQMLPSKPCLNPRYEPNYFLSFRGQDRGSGQMARYDFAILAGNRWSLWTYGNMYGTYDAILAKGSTPKGFNMYKSNTLRIVALGSHIDLYINGVQVGSADDPTQTYDPQGEYPMLLGAQSCGQALTALFTDLVIRTPH